MPFPRRTYGTDPSRVTTIDEMQAWVQPLAQARQVIAVEMQGHGCNAGTDRPMSFVTMGDDIATLLESIRHPENGG